MPQRRGDIATIYRSRPANVEPILVPKTLGQRKPAVVYSRIPNGLRLHQAKMLQQAAAHHQFVHLLFVRRRWKYARRPECDPEASQGGTVQGIRKEGRREADRLAGPAVNES